ncbi:molybdenum cofactor guanylyltransferase MobA [Candidatus Marinarcus aquaticus]|uniref:Probable molybdenum cofactor guanylyltransferase n=1 Tax=Candidatus Marinarcus aquaticus TaxID=2044504 RepID=A0A4Q0XRJ9_9BACT|nr:molybdenum cofactor guanylyltransferase MobA [Candidatus Marinarcus aquaticus]RXJ57895.1 molybdenum cofactor guanylyltransferase [Candidatus Marinarcus aquaticus]
MNNVTSTLTNNKNTPIVILCGGKSSRMQRDKSLLPFNDYTSLIQYQYERLKSEFTDVYISTKKHKFDFLDSKHEDIIYDKDEEYSPIVALQTIFETLKSEKVCIITVDTPLITTVTINKLINASLASDITIATTSNREHNLCGVFSKNVLSFIKNMLRKNIHKVGYLLKHSRTNYLKCENEEEFLNMNTPDDYKAALARISLTNK